MSHDTSAVAESEREPGASEPAASANSLDDLTDAELIKAVEDLETEVRHLQLENQVFENFLLKNDPVLISGMAQVLEVASKMQSQSQNQSTLTPDRRFTVDSLQPSSKKTESVAKFATTTISTTERGPRVNLSQKMDLAMREMEEMQLALEEFIQRSHRIKCNLKAKLEEIGIRESEVTEAREIFEQKVVIEGLDTLTQRIPAEKFLRYMDEWLKSADSTIEKMRLRTSTLKSMFTKLSNQLILKEELGEQIDAVDFDQLRIENQHLAEKIEQKNTHLLELKKMNGTANLVLSTNKKYLQKQVQELNKIKNDIISKEQKIIQLDKECEDVERKVDKVKEKYEEIVDLREQYRVPDTIEYIRTKAKLEELKKGVKIWERRNNIQKFALKTHIRKMKAITGIRGSLPAWFQHADVEKEDSEVSLPGDTNLGNRSSSQISNNLPK